MTELFNEIAQNFYSASREVHGYSQVEIDKMEDFYNIKITGDLRRFFSEFGRSSGGLRFDCFVIPYSGYYVAKTPSIVSGHVATQLEFKDDLMKHGRPFCTGKPFLFSLENETQYYFLRTKADEPLRVRTPEDDYSQLSEDPEIIYHYDENEGIVRNTHCTFKKYLSSRVSKSLSEKSGAGEMLLI